MIERLFGGDGKPLGRREFAAMMYRIIERRIEDLRNDGCPSLTLDHMTEFNNRVRACPHSRIDVEGRCRDCGLNTSEFPQDLSEAS
jgi:hypothetical protein